jgi:PadR family transcriptional regulator PadR
MHGYALVKHIKQVPENILQVEEGWLESGVGTSAKGLPTRIYRLTDAGLGHLEQEVVSFEKMFAGISRVCWD